jgi:hypothetical protein
MKKPNRTPRQNSVKRKGRTPNPYWLAAFPVILTAIIAVALTRMENIETNSTYDPHTYSFIVQGRRISGESSNPFERTQGYLARVESCEKYGVGDIYAVVSCYLTVRPLENLTISNSENPTNAVYEDGSFATICCMHLEDNPAVPLFRIRLPQGTVTRRTYQRGSEIHIVLNIPGADPRRSLDAISFSPGGRAPAVLFPLRGNLIDRSLYTEVINRHRNNPRIQEAVRDAIQARDELRSQARENQGLTYPQ